MTLSPSTSHGTSATVPFTTPSTRTKHAWHQSGSHSQSTLIVGLRRQKKKPTCDAEVTPRHLISTTHGMVRLHERKNTRNKSTRCDRVNMGTAEKAGKNRHRTVEDRGEKSLLVVVGCCWVLLVVVGCCWLRLLWLWLLVGCWFVGSLVRWFAGSSVRRFVDSLCVVG